MILFSFKHKSLLMTQFKEKTSFNGPPVIIGGPLKCFGPQRKHLCLNYIVLTIITKTNLLFQNVTHVLNKIMGLFQEYCWESLAEFSLYLNQNDEIFCHCSRNTIDDRDLINFGRNTILNWVDNSSENGSENGENEAMKSMGLPISFLGDSAAQKTFKISHVENDKPLKFDVYEQPLQRFDPEFEAQQERKILADRSSFCFM